VLCKDAKKTKGVLDLMASKFKYNPKRKFPSKSNIVKITVGIIFVLAVIIIATSLPYIEPEQPTTTTTTTFTTTTAITTITTPIVATGTGEVIIGLKDVPQKVPSVGSITSLNLNLTKVEVRDTSGEWFTIDEQTKSLDLITFTDRVAAVGKNNLNFGKYDQIRLHVASASIKVYSLDFNIYNKTYDSPAVNGMINVTHEFVVAKDKTLAITLDFDIPQTVKRTAASIENPTGYYLDPVIEVTEEYLNLSSIPSNFMFV